MRCAVGTKETHGGAVTGVDGDCGYAGGGIYGGEGGGEGGEGGGVGHCVS